MLIGIAATAGAAVAGRHFWLQSLPPDRVPSCGPGLGYIMDSLPLGQALSRVFSGSGEATVDWSLLGLSMPAWVLIRALLLGIFGIWNNLRRAWNLSRNSRTAHPRAPCGRLAAPSLLNMGILDLPAARKSPSYVIDFSPRTVMRIS